MGLAEKRAIKEFEANIYPGLKQKIDTAAGFPVEIEVDWASLAKEEKYRDKWPEAWPKLYFQPIEDAFKGICSDDMGRDALKGALKKIVVQNTKDSYSSYWATFTDGVLVLDYMFTNVGQIAERTQLLRDAVEEKL